MTEARPQKSINDYRHDIQLLKHKLQKLTDQNNELKSRCWLNESTDRLYAKPIVPSKKHKTTEQYFLDLYRIVRYRGLNLEGLFRCCDIVTNGVVKVSTFEKFLVEFLNPSDPEDKEREEAIRNEVQKMVAHIVTELDQSLKGSIDRNEYTSLLQIYRVECEQFDLVVNRVTLLGNVVQTYRNVFEMSLDHFREIVKEVGIEKVQTVIQKEFPETFTRDGFQRLLQRIFNVNTLCSGAIFNLSDRYLRGETDAKTMNSFIGEVMMENYILKDASNYLNLRECDIPQELKDFRALLTRLKIDPYELFTKVDTKQTGKVHIGEIFLYLESIIKFKYEVNRIQFWLRLIDYDRTYMIDAFTLIYSLLTQADIGTFGIDEKRRQVLLKISMPKNDLEVITLLAFRMKSFDMKPSHWYAMIPRQPKQQSVTVYDVRDSLLNLGLDLNQTIDVLKLLDRNINFFVEYQEMADLFGKNIMINEQEELTKTIKNFTTYLIEKHESLEQGIRALFDKYDTEGRKMLSREELFLALDQMDKSVQFTEEQKAIIIDKADANRDNMITFKEFKDWLTSFQ